jgi:type II secretory pathway pseudopilin PulG
LIELLIVVAIIAILAAIAVPNFLEAQTRAKVSRSKADMRSTATALEAYAVDWNHYPPNVKDAAERANVMTMPMGVMPFVPYVLTSPVAYMTGVPLDHFKPRIMDDHRHSFQYYNPLNLPAIEDRARLRAFADGAPASAFETYNAPAWFTISLGPDLQFGVMAREVERRGTLPIYELMTGGMMLGPPQQYDPTNGTISQGDILRFGP